MHSSVIRLSVILAGGGVWSTAALYHLLILIHDLRGRGDSAQHYLYILSHRLHSLSPILLKFLPNGSSQPYESPLVSPWFLTSLDSLVDKSPRLRRYPQVVVRHPVVRLLYGTPELNKDLVYQRPCLTAGRT